MQSFTQEWLYIKAQMFTQFSTITLYLSMTILKERKKSNDINEWNRFSMLGFCRKLEVILECWEKLYLWKGIRTSKLSFPYLWCTKLPPLIFHTIHTILLHKQVSALVFCFCYLKMFWGWHPVSVIFRHGEGPKKINNLINTVTS